MRRAIITLLVLLSFGLKAQVYQAMPQAGYGPVKRMLFDSVLTIPLNINQLRNITGGRDAGQIRYNVSDSGLYVFTGYTWIKANLDSVNLSNRINGKLNISDTAYMLSWYMRKTDTLSLSNRINLRVKYTDTAAMLDPYLRKLDTASLSRRIDEKQNIIKLTTNFKSGAATLIRDTLNIPKYSDTLQDNYVPYVGAIKDVDLGAYQLNANSIKSDYLLQVKNTPFSITPTSDYTSITPDKTGFVFYTSWLQGQSTYTQSNRFNYANQAQQNNTREYNLPVRNGTLALVEDTVNLSNRINLKADKATVLTINGVGYDLSANRTWTIPTFDSTSISNRINLKLNISDTASMLSPYLRKADTSSLSNRINLKTDKSTTLTINGTSYDLSANRSWTIPTVDTTSLSNRINLKVNISDTAAMLNPYLRKVDTTNAFLTSVSQPNDSTLSFVKGSTLSSYIIRASTQGSATKLITNVYNNSGATILKGSVVYINGAHSSNLPTIALALASNEATSAFTYGVVENDIPNNTAGVVVQNGVVTGLNLPTATYSDGQTLYLSPTVAGGYTLTKVIAPNHYVAVGTVTRAHPTFGTIQVAIRNGFQLDELSDVLIAAVPLDSTVLQFSRVDSLWHDVSITSAIGSKYIKPTDTTSLSNRINAKADALSGTTNTVPKFTSGTTIGNSNIKDNGNVVTVNATAGSFGALQVGSYNGNILMNTTNSNGGLIFQNTSSSNKLWDFSSDNNDLVFNESNIAPVMKLKAGGNVVISNLSGTGTRMVVADANGVLSSQAISSDTTSLSNRINLKLNISDTASMLSPYLRKVDTSSLSNRINLKLNISDTASMLSGYQSAINSKQPQLSGTGFVKASGTTISYDNSSYYLASNPNGYTSNTGTVTSVASGLGLSGGTITTSGTLLVDTASASILSRQRAANTYATISSLSGYLPLTGGTLTGALGGTSATFSGSVGIGITPTNTLHLYKASGSVSMTLQTGANYGYVVNDGTNIIIGSDIGSTGSKFLINRNAPDNSLVIASTGAATFSNNVTVKGILSIERSINAQTSTLSNEGGNLTISSNSGYNTIFQDGTTERMRINTSGNVGIGTTSPSTKLVIATSNTLREFDQVNSTTAYVETLDSARSASIYNSNYSRGHNFFTRNSGSGSYVQSFTIAETGNVGIGTISPDRPLDIYSAATVGVARIRANNVNGAAITMQNDENAQSISIYAAGSTAFGIGGWAGNSVLESGTGIVYSAYNGNHIFQSGVSGRTERMRITSGGNVLIGTTSNGGQLLQVNGTSSFLATMSMSYPAVNVTANTPLYWNNSNGNIGINTSSKRYKTDIVSLTKEQAEIALALNPVEYTRIETGQREYGFIAEEVKEAGLGLLVPEIDGQAITIDYAKLVTFAIAMIKEQQAQIKELQTEIQTLKNK